MRGIVPSEKKVRWRSRVDARFFQSDGRGYSGPSRSAKERYSCYLDGEFAVTVTATDGTGSDSDGAVVGIQ